MTPSKTRKIFRGSHFALELEEDQPGGAPAGWQIAITRKKVRLATARNRWKRRVVAVLRYYRPFIPTGSRMKWSLDKPSDSLSHKELEEEILDLLKKAGVILRPLPAGRQA